MTLSLVGLESTGRKNLLESNKTDKQQRASERAKELELDLDKSEKERLRDIQKERD